MGARKPPVLAAGNSVHPNFKKGKIMELISGTISLNSGEDDKFGKYLLAPFEGQYKFVLSSDKVDIAHFLNRPVEAEGYRTRQFVGRGKAAFHVARMTGLEKSGGTFVTAEGTLRKLEITTFQYGTHGFYDQAGKILYALNSKNLNLDIYIGHTVIVTGYPAIGYPMEGGPAYMMVTDVHIPLHCNLGKTFEVKLRGNYTTGYTWSVENISAPSVIELVGEDYIIDSQELIGSGGTAIFTFKTKETESSSLTFINSRSWDTKDIVGKIKYLITVE